MYSKFVANYPWVTILIDVILVLICGPISLWYTGFPDFSDPYRGLEPRGTEIRGRDLANTRLISNLLNGTFKRLSTESTGLLTPVLAIPNDALHASSCVDEMLVGVAATQIPPTLKSILKNHESTALPRLVVQPISATESLWTAEHMKSICDIESEVITSKLQVTCEAHSLPYYVTVLQNTTCDQITSRDMDDVLHLLQECSDYFSSGNLSSCFFDSDACESIPSNCSKYNAVYYILNYFTDVDFKIDAKNDTHLAYSQIIFRRSWNISTDDLFKYFMTNLDDNTIKNDLIKVKAYDMDKISGKINSAYVLNDLPYYGIALALVVTALFLYLRSVALMVLVMVNVGNSLAVSYFLYHVVLRFTYFGFGNILAALLLISIGADDVFIFYDIWNKIKYSAVDPQSVNIEDLTAQTLHHAFTSISVTSLTTSAALFANLTNDLTVLKAFGIFSGICILVNLYFMATLVPSVLVILEKVNRKYPWCACGWADKFTTRLHKFSQYVWNEVISTIVVKGAIAWIIILFGVGIYGFVAVFYYPQLKLPQTENIPAFVSDHPLEVYNNEVSNKFRFEIDHDKKNRMRINLNFVFGVDSKDNGDHFNPDNTGILKLDPKFNIYPEENQLWLKGFCHNLLEDKLIYDANRYTCFMDLYEMVVTSGCSYPEYNITLSTPCCMSNFPLSESAARGCYKNSHFLKLLHILSTNYSFIGAPVFDSNNDTVAVLFQVETKQVTSANYEIIKEFYNHFKGFMEKELGTAPTGLKQGWFTGSFGKELFFYDLQSVLLSGVISGIGLSMAVAFVIMLITSGNFFITLYAIITIMFVIIVTVGVFAFLGWELGVSEALTITLSIGLSIDFTIHFGIAYIVSPEEKRHLKVKEAVGTVGFAVFMAAFTTFLSGTALLGGTVLSYYKFGLFLMIDMTVSWVFSTFFFLSVCTFIGPLGSFGQLSVLFTKCKQLVRGKEKSKKTCS